MRFENFSFSESFIVLKTLIFICCDVLISFLECDFNDGVYALLMILATDLWCIYAASFVMC